MWNLWAPLQWLCDVQDALSAGDRCPCNMLLQEDVSVLSEVDDLLYHWEVEAEVALGAEWGSGTAQSWAEPWSHHSSWCGQMPSWIPGMLLNQGVTKRNEQYSIMPSMVQSPRAPPSFPHVGWLVAVSHAAQGTSLTHFSNFESSSG